MWHLGEIKISGFGPFRDSVEIPFNEFQGKLVLITAENQTTTGATSNGGGKSSIFEAVSWALFGEGSKGVDYVEDVINSNEDTATVSIKLYGKSSLIITRSRSRGGNKGLEIIENGVPKDFSTYSKTQDYLFHLLGIGKATTQEFFNDFLNSTYISTEVINAFTGAAKSKDRMAIISRFWNLIEIENAIEYTNSARLSAKQQVDDKTREVEILEANLPPSTEELKAQIASTTQDIKKHTKEVEGKKLILAHARQVNEVSREWDKTRTLLTFTTEERDNKINALITRVKDLQVQLGYSESLTSKLAHHQSQLSRLESGLKDLELKLVEVEGIWERLKVFGSDVVKKEVRVTELQSQMNNILTCPKCGDPLLFSNGSLERFDLNALNTKLARALELHQEALTLLKEYEERDKENRLVLEQVRSHKKDINNVKGTITDIQSQLRAIPDVKASIDSIEKSRRDLVSQFGSKITNLEAKLGELEQKLIELNSSPGASIEEAPIEREINELVARLGHLNATKGNLEVKLQSVEDDLKRLNLLKKELSKWVEELDTYTTWVKAYKEIHRQVIEGALPTLEILTNKFLSELESGLKISISTLRDKEKGGVTEDFNIKVTSSDGTERSLKTFSQGETRRIGICFALALKTQASIKGYQPLDLVMYDEVFDGLDQTGQEEFIKLITRGQSTNVIISHSPEMSYMFHYNIHLIKSFETVKVEVRA